MAEWTAAREVTERPAAEEHAVMSESTAAREVRVRPAAEDPSGAEQFDAGFVVARGAHDSPRCDSSRASTLIWSCLVEAARHIFAAWGYA